MIKALFKKQLLEVTSWLFQDKKSGKSRSKSSIMGYVLIFGILFVFLGSTFYQVGKSMCIQLVQIKMDWLYHAIMSLMAITLGVFGSVFSTFSTLYTAKDNDLLLSMPIPPTKIILVRLFGVWFWGTIYEALVLIPSILVYCTVAHPSITAVIAEILLLLVISVFVLTVSCLLGWVVAKINEKLKTKSFVTVFISIVFMAAYLYFYSQANILLQNILANAQTIGAKIRGAVYPVYVMGKSGEGDFVSLLIFSAMVLALFAIMYLILSKSFIRLATSKSTSKKKYSGQATVRARSIPEALLIKERRRFTSSSVYMLNCGLGTLAFIALSVFIIIKAPSMRTIIAKIGRTDAAKLISLIACGALCMVSSMNDITAPSVSLEGKSIWLLQSLPVSTWQVLKAKIKLHLLMTEIPACICSVCVAVVMRQSILISAMIILLPMLFILLLSEMGLAINLKTPNLTWANESVAVKQSLGVFLALFGGWVIVIVLAIAYYLLYKHISVEVFMLICAFLFTVSSVILMRWLKIKGTKIFMSL